LIDINGLTGSSGDDAFVDPGPYTNTFNGGPGSDAVDYSTAHSNILVDLTRAGTVADPDTATGADIGNDALISIETIKTGSGNDYVAGGSGIDTFHGGAGYNYFFTGAGDDTVTGGSTNTVHYAGNAADYTITDNGGSITVLKPVGSGSDTLFNVATSDITFNS